MLHVEEVGTGTPVMLLHSSGLSSAQWKRLAQLLAANSFRAVLVDLTGQGKSPPLPEGTHLSWRDDVQRIVELAPKRIVGHSYGGLVALNAALSLPVEKVILYDPVAFGILDRTADVDAFASLAPIDLSGGEDPASREIWLKAFVDYWSGTGAWDSLREPARAEFSRVGWAVREGVVTLMQDQPAHYPTLPLSLLTGEHTPIAAQRVVERLAAQTGADVTRIPGAGHMGPLSHGDVVNAKILDLLAQ